MKTLAPFLITGNITLSQEPLANLGWTSAAQRPSSMTWYIKRKIQISQTENNYREGKLFGGWGGCWNPSVLSVLSASPPRMQCPPPLPFISPRNTTIPGCSPFCLLPFFIFLCAARAAGISASLWFSSLRHKRCYFIYGAPGAERPIKTLFTAKRQHHRGQALTAADTMFIRSHFRPTKVVMNKQHKTTSVVLSLVCKLHESLFEMSAAPLI